MSTQPGSLFDSGASNIDILESIGSDILSEHGSSEPSPAATSEGASGTPLSPGAGAAGSEDTTPRPEWFETAPEPLKGLLGQQNISADAKKFLEETYGELNSFKSSPYGSKESVQELSELFPGGIEDVRSAHENAALFTRQMEQVYSNDPSQQMEMLSQIVTTNPDAFVTMIGTASELLKQTLRDDYTSFASGLAHDHLESITDGKFSGFFDGVSKMVSEYHGLAETNPEAAARVASKLASASMQMADWWGGAKNKLGYGERTASSVTSARGAVAINKPDDSREVSLAQREANFFTSNYMLKHDAGVAPLISQAMTRELAARKMELPGNWQKRVEQIVADGIKSNLAQDKTYLALENRYYRRGAPNDPRKWDNSEQAAKTLLSAARQRAEKLVQPLLKKALDELSTLRPQAAPKAVPGAAIRGGGGSPAAGAGSGGAGNWEQELKEGKISGADAVMRIAGY